MADPIKTVTAQQATVVQVSCDEQGNAQDPGRKLWDCLVECYTKVPGSPSPQQGRFIITYIPPHDGSGSTSGR